MNCFSVMRRHCPNDHQRDTRRKCNYRKQVLAGNARGGELLTQIYLEEVPKSASKSARYVDMENELIEEFGGNR